MKRRSALCAACLFMVATVLPAFSGEFETSLKDGAWALQFGIGSDFRLTTFEASAIALKRHFSDRAALRAVVDLSVEASESVRDDTPDQPRYDRDNDRWGVDLTLLYQRYFAANGRTAAYFGVGPKWGYDKIDGDTRSTQAATDSTDAIVTTASLESESWSLGGSAVLGAEWFASTAISLHAEYQSEVVYRSQTRIATTTTDGVLWRSSVEDESSWNIDQGVVRFGLSVYF